MAFGKQRKKIRTEKTVVDSDGVILSQTREKDYEVDIFYYFRVVKNGLFPYFDTLCGNDLRVMFFLFNEVRGDKNIIEFGYSQKELLKGLNFRGSSYECFRKSMGKLIRVGVIKKVELHTYMINPLVCYSGKMREYDDCISSWNALGSDKTKSIESMFEQERGEYSKLINSSDNE